MGAEGTRRTDDGTTDVVAVAEHGTGEAHRADWSFLAAHSGFTLDRHTCHNVAAPAAELPFSVALHTGIDPTLKSCLITSRSRRVASAAAAAVAVTAVAVASSAVAGPAVADTTSNPVGATLVQGAQVAAGAKPSVPAAAAGPLTVAGPTAALKVGTKAVFRGTITKAPYRRAGYPIALQVLRGSSWANVLTGNTTTQGSYSIVLPMKSAGQAYYRVRTAGAGTVAPRASVAVPVMAGVGNPSAYALMKDRFRFDPCSTIGYRVNLGGAPSWVLADVHGSISRISMATGLRFAYKGTTSVVPFTPNAAYPSDTSLVFAFVNKGVNSALPAASRALAVGGPQTAWGPSQVNGRTWARIANAGVLIDRNANLTRGFAQTNAWPYVTMGGVVLHELGHAVGLDHVYSDKLAMMATPPSPHSSELSLGDYAGLKQLGAASGCFR